MNLVESIVLSAASTVIVAYLPKAIETIFKYILLPLGRLITFPFYRWYRDTRKIGFYMREEGFRFSDYIWRWYNYVIFNSYIMSHKEERKLLNYTYKDRRL